MTERERLIEILHRADIDFMANRVEIVENALNEDFAGEIVSKQEFLADYILADGWIRPPCKVGDTVYVKYYGEIVNAYVTEFEINSKGIVARVYIDPDTDREYDAEDLFLNEEAEQALQRKEEEK